MEMTQLLQLAVQHRASDLHLSSGMPPMVRIDAAIERLPFPPLSHTAVQALLHGLPTQDPVTPHPDFPERDFAFSVDGLGRFRANVFAHQRGVAGVFRVIPEQIPELHTLGGPAVLARMASLPRGMVLVTGATGSGKSTTLAAMLQHKNRTEQGHIVTIEDPIEFLHASHGCLIHQREVHRDTLSFSAALRAALREDPDTLLIGELRDLETIRLALTAAETGHLVLATLHTHSAAKAIDRLIDVFPGNEKDQVRSMLAESLQAVIAQTLVKKASGGRVAAYEILVATPAVRNLIRENRVAQLLSIMQTGAQWGMLTLEQSLATLVQAGSITAEAAQRHARQAV